MTDTESVGLRSWTLAPKGIVQFKTSAHPMSVAALGCLGSRVNRNVSFDIAPNVLGSKVQNPVNVTLKVKSGQWIAENGTDFDVSVPKIKPMAEVAVQKARDRLNKALRSPLDIHLTVVSIYPEYATPNSNDRPVQTPPIRTWRRTDARWIKNRILAPKVSDTPRDAFDRAIELIDRLDRPVQMQWVYFGHHDGAHRIALRVKKQLCNPIIALKAVETKLFVDSTTSLNGVETQRQILGTHMMALVQALRRYGARSIGDIEIRAYVVEAFDQTENGQHVLNLWVDANAWGIAVGQASRMKVEALLSTPPKGIRYQTTRL